MKMNDLNSQILPGIGSISYQGIRQEDISALLKQLLDLREYKNIKRYSPDLVDLAANSNQVYWNLVKEGKVRKGHNIFLSQFSLTEWAPYSPGLFHTIDAEIARDAARHHASESQIEFTPLGKISMVKGGIGSVRLQPKNIMEKESNILGITSNGICHEGIPIIINNQIFNSHIDQIKEHGSITADFYGRIVLMPENNLIFANEIPKYCIELEKIDKVRNTVSPIYISVAVAYRTGANLDLSWTYKTVTPDKKDQHLKHASEWIVDYINRYSESEQSSHIFSDFDEHVEWFKKVDFRVNEIANEDKFDTKLFVEYIKKYDIRLGDNVIIGDNNILISGVKNSSIEIRNSRKD